jgi:hypothetical protein
MTFAAAAAAGPEEESTAAAESIAALPSPLVCKPIGVLRSVFACVSSCKTAWKHTETPHKHQQKPRYKNGTPRQGSVVPGARARLQLTGCGFTNPEHSLEGLEESVGCC